MHSLSNRTLPITLLLLSLWSPVAQGFPHMLKEEERYRLRRQVNASSSCQDQSFVPRRFAEVPYPNDTSSRPVPDAAHTFVAPGPDDQRGPCPGLNSLANHGYIPRNGIATGEEIIQGVMDAFNMGHDFASFIVSFGMLARGNPGSGTLSIGYNDTRVPALPGCPDGDIPGGLAKHGRFEGDVSVSRNDHDIGNSVEYNHTIFETLFPWVGEYGEASIEGPEPTNNLLNITAFGLAKNASFQNFQANDPAMTFHLDRQLATYFETAFALELMGGDTAQPSTITLDRMSTFFANQTFPADFRRRNGSAELDVLGGTGRRVRDTAPVPPGSNVDGIYVADNPPFTDFYCNAYVWLIEMNLPSSLNNQTGIVGENIELMIDLMYRPFRDTYNCTVKARPAFGDPGA